MCFTVNVNLVKEELENRYGATLIDPDKYRPSYYYHSGDEILSLAGLYAEWAETSTGHHLRTSTIITTEANDLMAEIHNSAKRMPAVLDKSDEKQWLDLSASSDNLISLLNPGPNDLLKAHTISPMVNDRTANRNNSDVIRPYIYGSDNRLF